MTATGSAHGAVVDAVARFRRRQAGAGRVRWGRWVALGVAVTATLTGGSWELLHSSLFALRTVSISLDLNSTSSLTSAEVSHALQPPVGRPLVDLDLRQLAARVAALPAVASVEVQRSWPRGLRVAVWGRAAAVELQADGERWDADRRGVVFARADSSSRALVRVELTRVSLTVRRAPWPQAAAAVAAVDSLPREVRAHAASLRVRRGDLWFDVRGVTVDWGGGAAGTQKAVELEAFLRRSRRRPGQVDLSTPGVVVTAGRAPKQHRSAGQRNHP